MCGGTAYWAIAKGILANRSATAGCRLHCAKTQPCSGGSGLGVRLVVSFFSSGRTVPSLPDIPGYMTADMGLGRASLFFAAWPKYIHTHVP